jgi:hypothetical protein
VKFRTKKNNMKRFLILIVLVLAGCGEQTPEEIIKQVNSSGTISDEQAESLSQLDDVNLDGLSSITDEQAESLSKVV